MCLALIPDEIQSGAIEESAFSAPNVAFLAKEKFVYSVYIK